MAFSSWANSLRPRSSTERFHRSWMRPSPLHDKSASTEGRKKKPWFHWSSLLMVPKGFFVSLSGGDPGSGAHELVVVEEERHGWAPKGGIAKDFSVISKKLLK
jgi:hypothetical protein